MKRIYIIISSLVWSFAILSANSYIVVGTDANNDNINNIKTKLINLVTQSDELKGVNVTTPTIRVSNHDKQNSYLEVGPFDRDNTLAINFMAIKKRFSNSFIMDDIAKIIEKKIYINDTTPENDTQNSSDTSLWIAVFGLAIIGIFFMFLSSDQLKRLKINQKQLMEKYKKLEEKQNNVLANMSENIHSLAKETVDNTSRLAQRVAKTPLKNDMDRVMDNENELLNIAGDLIKFLRLKSNKVIVSNAIFNLNNVLNELIGSVEKVGASRGIELIFDIDKHVSNCMKADSSHILNILVSLVEYAMLHSVKKPVKLYVSTIYSLTDSAKMQIEISSDFKIDDKEHLFDTYYDEETKRYVGLSLFVTKELIGLMNGELEILPIDDNSDKIVIILPIEEENKDRKTYKILQKKFGNKKMLIVDKYKESSSAIEKIFNQIKVSGKALSNEEFDADNSNFSQYDIIALNSELFTYKTISELKKLKQMKKIEIISLDNIFDYDPNHHIEIVDISLQKPLSPYNLYNILESYAEIGKQDVNQDNALEEHKASLAVHKETFVDTDGTRIEDFKNFSAYNLLLIEDNFINQKLMLGLLSKSNMNIRVANNGQEAVDYLNENAETIDFVLMDINMPVLDGFEATAKIRSDHRFDNIPIVALTALVAESEVDRMFNLGMNGYLSKPIKIDTLYTAMKTFLDEKALKEQEVNLKPENSKKFDGLDVVSGLKRTENNKIFYKEILHEFIDVYGNSDILFEKLVREERYEQVRMLCIDMKGLTGTIGAKQMQSVINKIHQNIIYKKPELLHTHIDEYKKELQLLNKSIKAYLEL